MGNVLADDYVAVVVTYSQGMTRRILAHGDMTVARFAEVVAKGGRIRRVEFERAGVAQRSVPALTEAGYEVVR